MDQAEASRDATTAAAVVPSVVAVMVTHDPGPWFEEALRSLVDQDYRNLSILVIDAGSGVDPTGRVAKVAPDAFFRSLGHNPGYGAAANQGISMVEGAAFYLLIHDDVALAPSAVRQLVEEAYRSNAAVVGPKIVRWDDPQRLLQIGQGSDKFGVPSPIVERNELDQEQHDLVRDVFSVPGGCILARADLIRELGGFDEAMTLHGEDSDLCWRAHLAGARVVTAPAAVVRHLEALGSRRPDDRRRLQLRHRLRAVLGNYGLFFVLAILVQQLALSAAEFLGALVTGRFRHAGDVFAAYTWNLRRLPSLVAKRRRNRRLRRTRDLEIRQLQVRGSARLNAWVARTFGAERSQTAALAEGGRQIVNVVRTGLGHENVWAVLAVAAVLLFGSRHLLTGGVPVFGEFTALGSGGFDLLGEWLAGWRDVGLGVRASPPTGLAFLGLGDLVLLGQSGLLRTLAIVGLLPLGAVGAWRMASAFAPRSRGALAALVAYVANPLPYVSLATGSWRGLAVYAAVPWIVRRLCVASGAAPFEPSGPERTERPLWARVAGLGLVVGLAALLYPAAPALVAVMAASFAVGSLIAGTRADVLRLVALGVGGGALAAVVHFPWLIGGLDNADPDLSVGGRLGEAGGYSVLDALHFAVSPVFRSPLSWGLFIAAVLPLVVAQGWRLQWAIRAWAMAAVPWLTVALERSEVVDLRLPPPEVLLVPSAAGLALAAAMGVLAFERDLRAYGFGWRQLASVVAAAGVVVAALPLLAASVDGRWDSPRGGYERTLRFQDEEAEEEGAFRVLWLGEPEVLPVAGWALPADVADGAYATTFGIPDARNTWTGPETAVTELIPDALANATAEETSRLGEALAPMGIRYVIVPNQLAPAPFGGVVADPDPALVALLEEQLDLVVVDVNPALSVFRNAVWRPMAVAAPLVEPGAVTIDEPAPPALTRSDVHTYEGELDAGSAVHLAEAFAEGWTLRVDGESQPQEVSVGWANGYAVEASGAATLAWRTPGIRLAFAALQALLGLVLLVVAVRRPEASPDLRRRRFRRATGPGEPVLVTGPLELTPEPVGAAREAGADADAEADARADSGSGSRQDEEQW